MNWEAISASSEIVGAMAVVLSLIYVGYQIRDNNISVQTQAELGLADQMSQWAKEVVDNPAMGTLWNKAAREPDNLTEEERMTFIWFVFQLFLIIEGHHELYMKGRISEQAFYAKAGTALGLLKNPHVKIWWDERIAPFKSEFVEEMEDKLGRTESGWKFQDINQVIETRTKQNVSVDV
jgi:hypothetical protein